MRAVVTWAFPLGWLSVCGASWYGKIKKTGNSERIAFPSVTLRVQGMRSLAGRYGRAGRRSSELCRPQQERRFRGRCGRRCCSANGLAAAASCSTAAPPAEASTCMAPLLSSRQYRCLAFLVRSCCHRQLPGKMSRGTRRQTELVIERGSSRHKLVFDRPAIDLHHEAGIRLGSQAPEAVGQSLSWLEGHSRLRVIATPDRPRRAAGRSTGAKAVGCISPWLIVQVAEHRVTPSGCSPLRTRAGSSRSGGVAAGPASIPQPPHLARSCSVCAGPSARSLRRSR